MLTANRRHVDNSGYDNMPQISHSSPWIRSLTDQFIALFVVLSLKTFTKDDGWFSSTCWCCCLNQRVLGAAGPKTLPLRGLRPIQYQLGRKRWQRAAVRTLMQWLGINVMQPHTSSQSTDQMKADWFPCQWISFILWTGGALYYFLLPWGVMLKVISVRL